MDCRAGPRLPLAFRLATTGLWRPSGSRSSPSGLTRRSGLQRRGSGGPRSGCAAVNQPGRRAGYTPQRRSGGPRQRRSSAASPGRAGCTPKPRSGGASSEVACPGTSLAVAWATSGSDGAVAGEVPGALPGTASVVRPAATHGDRALQQSGARPVQWTPSGFALECNCAARPRSRSSSSWSSYLLPLLPSCLASSLSSGVAHRCGVVLRCGAPVLPWRLLPPVKQLGTVLLVPRVFGPGMAGLGGLPSSQPFLGVAPTSSGIGDRIGAPYAFAIVSVSMEWRSIWPEAYVVVCLPPDSAPLHGFRIPVRSSIIPPPGPGRITHTIRTSSCSVPECLCPNGNGPCRPPRAPVSRVGAALAPTRLGPQLECSASPAPAASLPPFNSPAVRRPCSR